MISVLQCGQARQLCRSGASPRFRASLCAFAPMKYRISRLAWTELIATTRRSRTALPFVFAGLNCYVTTATAELLFCADCPKPYATGMWIQQQQWSGDRLQKEQASLAFPGYSVTRVEVHPGDNVGGWGGERAEMAGMRDGKGRNLTVGAATPKEYYGLSIKLAPDWRPPAESHDGSVWGTFFQLHGPDHLRAPPSMALMAEDRFHINFFSGDISKLDGRPDSKEFTDGALRAGKWVSFMLEVTWSPAYQGSVTVFRRDDCEKQWKQIFSRGEIPTLQYAGDGRVEEHYWKAGYYRSGGAAVSRLWLGPIARGTTWRDVEKAAFGATCQDAPAPRRR